jgi:hypothetical protein
MRTSDLLLGACYVVLGSLCLVIMIHGLRNWRRQEEAWSAFARGHGLTANLKKDWWVKGRYAGWNVEVTLAASGVSPTPASMTQIRLDLDGVLPRNSSLVPTYGWLWPREKARRGARVWTLEECSYELKDLLSDTVLQKLERLAGPYCYLAIQEGALLARQLGVPKSVQEMESYLQPAVDTARLLNELTGGTRPYPRRPCKARRSAGRLARRRKTFSDGPQGA